MHAVGEAHESAASTPPVDGGFGVGWICHPLVAALTDPAGPSTPVASGTARPAATKARTKADADPKASVPVNLRRMPLLPMRRPLRVHQPPARAPSRTGMLHIGDPT